MVLELDRLSLIARGATLLSDLSASVKAGEFWCILGRNGAGKTTLIKTLAGLREADRGDIRLDGRRLAKWPLIALAKRRAYLAQQVVDHFPATVRDTVMTARYPYHMHLASGFGLESQTDRDAVERALEQFDLGPLAQRDVLTLSGGERRRVSLATVFAQDTTLLFLDEPSAHLDLDIEQRVFAMLASEVRSGKTVVASVHDPNLAQRYATHAILLGAKNVRAGTLDEVLSTRNLAELFSHPVEELVLNGRRWFVPGPSG
jgi:iron complex transport system ATP-binding protein